MYVSRIVSVGVLYVNSGMNVYAKLCGIQCTSAVLFGFSNIGVYLLALISRTHFVLINHILCEYP